MLPKNYRGSAGNRVLLLLPRRESEIKASHYMKFAAN